MAQTGSINVVQYKTNINTQLCNVRVVAEHNRGNIDWKNGNENIDSIARFHLFEGLIHMSLL
jgi:hypothetical protein